MVPELTPKARTTRFALAALVVFVLTAGIGGLFAPPLEGSQEGVVPCQPANIPTASSFV